MRTIRVALTGTVAALAVVAVVCLSAGRGETSRGEGWPGPATLPRGAASTAARPPIKTRPAARGKAQSAIGFPMRGTGEFSVLPGDSTSLGRAGRVRTFQVAVEGGITGLDHRELGRFIRSTYGDPRGWTAGGRWRFRQVGPGERPDFKVLLTTPATRDRLCGHGYDRYTSCRIGDRVVLNIDRWANGVPEYGASLATYRQYMINHESGHRLGHAHELCPSPGAPAPVMQQQTLGLHGCTANPWPYRDGQRYRGPLGQYDDSTPTS